LNLFRGKKKGRMIYEKDERPINDDFQGNSHGSGCKVIYEEGLPNI
jgi:hypothetical protein